MFKEEEQGPKEPWEIEVNADALNVQQYSKHSYAFGYLSIEENQRTTALTDT